VLSADNPIKHHAELPYYFQKPKSQTWGVPCHSIKGYIMDVNILFFHQHTWTNADAPFDPQLHSQLFSGLILLFEAHRINQLIN